MEALPEALLLEQRASFMEDPSRQHLWAYLPHHFVLCGNFCDCRCNGAMTTLLFRQRNTEGLRVTNPTQCDSYFVHLDWPRQRRPCTLFSGARVGWAHFTAEHDLSSQDRARAKENVIYPPNLFLFRKKEWERERERERELQWRERVVTHASVGHTSSPSATCLHNLLPSWRKRAKERDLFSTAFSSSKKRLWEVFNDGGE